MTPVFPLFPPRRFHGASAACARIGALLACLAFAAAPGGRSHYAIPRACGGRARKYTVRSGELGEYFRYENAYEEDDTGEDERFSLANC